MRWPSIFAIILINPKKSLEISAAPINGLKVYCAMTKNQRFIWELYFFIVVLFTIRKAIVFFSPDSEHYLYFHVLQAFDRIYLYQYFLNVFRIILNIIHILPLALFIYQIKLFPATFWQILFTLKALLDVTGHTYEISFIRSLIYHDPLISLQVLITSVFIYIPAYAAFYMYAFNQEKLRLDSF